MRRVGLWVCAAVLAVAGASVVSAPASAAGARVSFATAYSAPGDWLGGGLSYLWSSAASDEIRVVPTKPATSSVDIEVLSADGRRHFYFLFQPPTGRQLARGVYVNTQRGATSTRAGLDLTSGDRGCNTETGRFEILDIGPGKSRFRALYEDYCDGGPAVFGEISYNEPASPQNLLAASDRIIWPATLPGRSSRVVPVAVENTSNYPTRFTKVSITKGSPYFRVTHNGCGLVRARSTCVVSVHFYPVTTGEHEGVLTAHGTRGDVPIELAGYGLQGHTDWTMTSQRGDPVGLGRSYRYSQRTSTMAAVGDSGQVTVAAVSDDGIAFSAQFSGVPHHPLVAGQHFRRTLTTSGPDAPNPGLEVTGQGRECSATQGQFDVLDATYSNGAVVRFAVNFVQHCGTTSAALTGKIDYEIVPPPASAPAWAGLTR